MNRRQVTSGEGSWSSEGTLVHSTFRAACPWYTRFCVEALKEALFKYGAPEIFNTDQGCQFTSEAFTSVLKIWNIKISMDGKGRFRDNIFVERLWRTLKYERIYLNVYETGAELSKDMTYWFNWYNVTRKHTSLDKLTPDEAYFQGLEQMRLVA